MADHWFDRDNDQTLCGEWRGTWAWQMSATVPTCPECVELLAQKEAQ